MPLFLFQPFIANKFTISLFCERRSRDGETLVGEMERLSSSCRPFSLLFLSSVKGIGKSLPLGKGGYRVDKFFSETPPRTESVVWDPHP